MKTELLERIIKKTRVGVANECKKLPGTREGPLHRASVLQINLEDMRAYSMVRRRDMASVKGRRYSYSCGLKNLGENGSSLKIGS